MSGIIRLQNNDTGHSTLNTAASNDTEYTIPDVGTDGTATLLTTNAHGVDAAAGISWSGFPVTISGGDINLNNGTLFIDESTNRVGIGTTTPNRALHITSSDPEQLVCASTGNLAGIFFAPDNTTYTPFVGGTENDLVFYTDGSEKARIDSDGRFLLGTDEPLENNTQLNVVGGGVNGAIVLARDDDSILDGQTVGRVQYWGNGGSGNYQLCASIDALVDGTHSFGDKPTALLLRTTPAGASTPVTRLKITNDGLIGINQEDPISPICVNSATGGDIYLQANNTDLDGGSSIFFKTTTTFNNTAGCHAVIEGRREDIDNGYFRISTRSSGSTQERMLIASNRQIYFRSPVVINSFSQSAPRKLIGEVITKPNGQGFADFQRPCIALARAYTGTTQNVTGFNGIIYLTRGGINASLTSVAAWVSCTSGYNQEHRASTSWSNQELRWVKFTYDGIDYMGVEQTTDQSATIWVDGWYYNRPDAFKPFAVAQAEVINRTNVNATSNVRLGSTTTNVV